MLYNNRSRRKFSLVFSFAHGQKVDTLIPHLFFKICHNETKSFINSKIYFLVLGHRNNKNLWIVFLILQMIIDKIKNNIVIAKRPHVLLSFESNSSDVLSFLNVILGLHSFPYLICNISAHFENVAFLGPNFNDIQWYSKIYT